MEADARQLEREELPLLLPPQRRNLLPARLRQAAKAGADVVLRERPRGKFVKRDGAVPVNVHVRKRRLGFDGRGGQVGHVLPLSGCLRSVVSGGVSGVVAVGGGSGGGGGGGRVFEGRGGSAIDEAAQFAEHDKDVGQLIEGEGARRVNVVRPKQIEQPIL